MLTAHEVPEMHDDRVTAPWPASPSGLRSALRRSRTPSGRAREEQAGCVAGPTALGRIFISYRREETAYPAGWLFDRLADHFGEEQVFKDIDSIEPGEDFVDVLNTAVGSCDVLLALIGPEWLTVTDQDGKRRLDNPADFVRLEIEAALSREVLVVPLLVDGARMPRAEDLPGGLAALARRNALELSPSHFDFEASRLLRVLDEALGEGRREPPASRSRRRDRTSDGGRARASRHVRLPRRGRILAGIGSAVVLAVLLPLLVLGLGSSGGSSDGAVFQDDFSSRSGGWDDAGAQRDGGHYANGAYRLYSQWTPDHYSDRGFPLEAKRVFPTAPRDVAIQVLARRVQGSGQDGAYGIACRASGSSYYQFTIGRDHFAIEKLDSGNYAELKSAGLGSVHADGENRMRAVCSSGSAGGATHLAFSVNGRPVLEATDRSDRQLSGGTVGLVVATDHSTIEAKFDDFVVTPA
jgi:hypothetical protein